MNELAFCTVVSKNYISYGRALARSLRRYHPDAPIFLLLADRIDGYIRREDEPCEVIELADLEIPNLPRFCFQYEIFELNCAAKAYFMLHLIERSVASKIVYIDSDMLALRELGELPTLLDDYSVVLTPHLLHEMEEDGRTPGEREILEAGIYNAGFIAVRRDQNAKRFLTWLARRVYAKCVHDPARELCFDQRWLDFVPGMFDGVHVLRRPGYNVGHWSLSRHTFESDISLVRVDGEPLSLFHFSGLDLDRLEQISKHQNRFTLSDLEMLRPIFEDYRERVLAGGYRETRDWPYAYGQFDGGVPIPSEARRLYRSLGETVERFGDPFAVSGRQTYFAWLNEEVRAGSGISRLWYQLYTLRPDVQQAFPDIFCNDRQSFLAWVYMSGRKEFGIHETLCPKPDYQPAVVATEAEVPAPSPMGVNIVGHAMSEKGVGEALRASARSLKAAGIPHAVIDFPDRGSANIDRTLLGFVEHNPYPVNLIHVNADGMPSFLNTFGVDFLRGRYNIGYWVWELPEFPPNFYGSFACLDEVWVPSSFCHEAVADASPVPVVKIPYSLPAGGLQTKDVGRDYFGLPKDVCIFLFMFDVHSIATRKNPSGVIRAFKQAFGKGDDVLLVLKLVHADVATKAALAEEAQDERVLFIDKVLARAEVNSLIEVCDCYVSLHRSEGFGMTMSESMALGKPVIATGYSGNMEFMAPSNSFLVDYKLVTLEQDYPPYPRGSTWADPDLGDASRLMRLVYDDPQQARRVGERAARDVWQNLSPEAVGIRMAKRLELIGGRLDGRRRGNGQAATLTAPGIALGTGADFALRVYRRARQVLFSRP